MTQNDRGVWESVWPYTRLWATKKMKGMLYMGDLNQLFGYADNEQ